MWFGKSRRNKERDQRQQAKMEESQRALVLAATATANAAHDVTVILQSKLADSVKRFESTSHIIKDALLLCGLDGCIQHANSAAMTLFGADRCQGNILNLFDQNGLCPKNPKILWEMLADESTWDAQAPVPLRGLKENGQTFEIEPRIEKVVWSDKSASVLVLIYDVSAITQLNNDAKRYEARYRSIFECSFDAIIITQNNTIIAANSSIERLYGHTPDYLLGENVNVLFKQQDHHLLEERTCATITGVHRGGTDLDLMFISSEIDWKDDKARIITIKEAGDKRQFESVIAEQRQLGSDMIVCFDPNFRVTFANQSFAKLQATERESLLNKDVRTLFRTKEELTVFTDSMSALSAVNPSNRIQVTITDFDGSKHVQDWIDYVVFDAAGKPAAYQRVGRDITDVVKPSFT